jgi:hypothetical protein
MQHFIINIFNNKTGHLIRSDLRFEGDLRTAKVFCLNLAKRMNVANCSAYIYDSKGYVRGDRFLAMVDYTKLKK